MRIGFTGRSSNVTLLQYESLAVVLAAKHAGGFTHLHHGDCINADKLANDTARHLGYATKGHPPINETYRAFATVDELADPKEYLVRNGDIVTETLELIAVPSTKEEILRSGTWSTVRRARKLHHRITFIFPDGSIEVEEPDGTRHPWKS